MRRHFQCDTRDDPPPDGRSGSHQPVWGPTPSTPSVGENNSFDGVNGNVNAGEPTRSTSRSNLESSPQLLLSGGVPEAARAFEPLISSLEAAKLLGNIHVKTLQRYARHGNLPGYRIASQWFFRASELDAWLHSRINSNSQPADRVDLTVEKIR